MLIRILQLLLLIVAVFLPSTAHAHVFVKDNSGQYGTVLHIEPADNPVAGEESTLYFSFQDSTIFRTTHLSGLILENEDGESEAVPIKVDGVTVTANYIFPEQGVYKFNLIFHSIDSSQQGDLEFIHNQRVSSGVASSALDQQSHRWAENLVLTSAISIIALLIFMFNRRSDISFYSRF